MTTIRQEISAGVARIWLDRPDVRNALNDVMIRELAIALRDLPSDVRVVVITGSGDAFCAGADLQWMKNSAAYTEQENLRDARALMELLLAVNEMPRVVIGRINGPAMGGALGLLACCDLAVAQDNARFGFTEVRLGLVPAVISPFVIHKIGAARARRYFVTGEIFDASTALTLGLVDHVVAADQLDTAVDKIVQSILACAPHAVGEAKSLVQYVSQHSRQEVLEYTVKTIARLRTSPEGQEGLSAFLEKRKPRWSV